MSPDDLLSKIDHIEELVRTGIAGHLDAVERLLLSIARSARAGEVANLAMKALSAASALKRSGVQANAADGLNAAISRLRVALMEVDKRG